MAETTLTQQAICPHDRRELQECRLRPHVRRKRRRKTDLGQKDICPSRIWIQNILAVTNQNVDIRQRIPGYIFCLHGIQPHLVGIDQTSHRPNRQQICYTFFPNQNNTTSFVERLRFRPTV